jgi:hypothetical protein
MAIARMIVRTGLLTVALMSAVATAKAICRVTRLPSRSEGKPERMRSQRVRSRSELKSRHQAPRGAILQVSSCMSQDCVLPRFAKP